MMKSKSILLIITLVVLFFSSCEEDFDITADYKDITIAYGLLDLGQDTTFLRINKAFLGDGNVLEMAKVEDSSIYVNGLSAIIEEYYNSSLEMTFTLDTITISNKKEGLFYNPYQLLYYGVFEVKPDRKYNLKVNVKDKVITGSTAPVNDFSMEKPSAGAKFINFNPEMPTNSAVIWESAANGKRYETVIRFNYKEVMEGDQDTVYKYIDWNLGTSLSKATTGGEEMDALYSDAAFYSILADRVPYSDPAKEAKVTSRYTNSVDFIISVAGEELNTYIEVNEPSNSIIQEKPDYTNLNNGLGVFSSRFKKVREKKIHPDTISRILALNLKFVY